MALGYPILDLAFMVCNAQHAYGHAIQTVDYVDFNCDFYLDN